MRRFAYVGLFFVLYVLSALVTVRFLIRSGSDVAVPALVGLSRSEAERRLSPLGLRLTVEGELFSDGLPAGVVLDQSIAASERVREGRGVGVVLSKGPRARHVPRLVGLGAGALSVVLASSRWEVGRTVRSCAEGVSAGSVVAQHPPAGTAVAADRVDLLISNGTCNDRFVMRDFSGWASDEAVRRLKERGFSVDLTRDEVEGATEGTVLSQDPPAGALVSLREPVRFTVAGRAAAEGEGRWVRLRAPSFPSLFRKEGALRLERDSPFGSSVIDFLLTPGNNPEFVVWLSDGDEVALTVGGEEIMRRTYPWP